MREIGNNASGSTDDANSVDLFENEGDIGNKVGHKMEIGK